MRPPQEAAGDRVYEGSFPAQPQSPRRARAAVGECCRAWHLLELYDDVALIVSELVTNAVRHAGTEVRLRLERLPHGVRLEVADDSTRPLRQVVGYADEGGRGLPLVDALSTRYGVEGRPDGKVVWAELVALAG